MLHFTEDIHQENIIFIIDAEFLALKAMLLDYSLVGGTTQGFEDNKEADSIDLQDATLVDLRYQTTKLSCQVLSSIFDISNFIKSSCAKRKKTSRLELLA